MRNRQIVLKTRPNGFPKADHFQCVETDLPEVPEKGLLIKNHYLSIDPAMRGWITDLDNYLPAVPVGGVMRSLAVGEVLASNHPEYQVGEKITGWFDWQDFAAITPDKVLRKLGSDDISESACLGILGLNGITAWLALETIGLPKTGQTILISTAAGAVGSIAGQLANAKGCTVIGLTSNEKKAQQCLTSFGYHKVIIYPKEGNQLEQAIKQQCPEGIDIFFDNTAGSIADAVYPSLNLNARVIQCGTSSIDNWSPLPEGPRRERYFITKRIMQQGFVVFDHIEQWPEVVRELSILIKAGKLTYFEDIKEDLFHAPAALESLYLGQNLGKSIVKI